jgi:hypothetical protein
MVRCAIIRVDDDLVVNVVEYSETPRGVPPGFSEGHLAIEAEGTVGPGWTYAAGAFIDPNPPAAPEQLPNRYLLAEDFVRLVSQLPSGARDAIRQARAASNDVEDLWSLMLSKGSTRIDLRGTTFVQHAWPALSQILEPVIGEAGLAAFEAAIVAVATPTR